jgi:hypothetical protein
MHLPDIGQPRRLAHGEHYLASVKGPRNIRRKD